MKTCLGCNRQKRMTREGVSKPRHGTQAGSRGRLRRQGEPTTRRARSRCRKTALRNTTLTLHLGRRRLVFKIIVLRTARAEGLKTRTPSSSAFSRLVCRLRRQTSPPWCSILGSLAKTLRNGHRVLKRSIYKVSTQLLM